MKLFGVFPYQMSFTKQQIDQEVPGLSSVIKIVSCGTCISFIMKYSHGRSSLPRAAVESQAFQILNYYTLHYKYNLLACIFNTT